MGDNQPVSVQRAAALTDFPLSGGRRSGGASRLLAILAALWATGASLYLLFAPTYRTSAGTSGLDSSASTRNVEGTATLLDVNGPEVLFVLGIPVLLAVAPLAFRARRRAALLGAGALMLLFCILGALSVGTRYLPAALLLLLAGAKHPQDTGSVAPR